MVDLDLADALFLADHPGWSWHDLMTTPADVVETIRAIDISRGEAQARAAKAR